MHGIGCHFGKTGVRHIKKAGADSITFREAVLAEDNTLKFIPVKSTESPEELAGRSGHSDKRRREKELRMAVFMKRKCG